MKSYCFSLILKVGLLTFRLTACMKLMLHYSLWPQYLLLDACTDNTMHAMQHNWLAANVDIIIWYDWRL